ncbi:alpha/beta hydrolase [Microcoleus sp. LEGE 07076]|uniref:alpha/beta fold hydrolase n=1 Tax=Microcoleus sp. LEGE 07076 TaxID=915322 RepID=UPI00187DE690|nr:alpha/beta hydrolase [Microcoleus sp. LEGE 07076]MBE9186984.1 alpha/beta hydrolase [Microcoleus sp. LEGE 07076]
MATIDILGVRHACDLTAPTANSPVLVFVHGWLLSRRYWQPLTDRLAPNYQCLTYDLRGFGDSQCDGGSGRTEPLNSCYTASAYARDLEILLEKLDISNAWLVGHSLGGTIALWAASQFSDRVKGVVCINAGGGIYLKEEFERFRSVGKQLVKMRPRWLCRLPLADFVFARDSVARSIGASWGRQRLIDFVAAHPDAALGALLDSTTEAEIHLLPQIVSQLKQPVYFIAGTKDKIMEPKYVLHLASFHWMFQGCGENVLQLDCGHLAMVEQPDAVASYLQNMLHEHG